MNLIDTLLTPSTIAVIIVVILIIIIQISVSLTTKKRMDEYENTFVSTNKLEVKNSEPSEPDRRCSIEATNKNSILNPILKNINDYISSNANGVIDFQIIKDTVDRHCDSVENEIETQLPTPLYLGLVGSMFGIIIGLAALAFKGTDIQHLDPKSLLFEIAIAMIASLVGIICVAVLNYIYKVSKVTAEENKGEFLSWLQSELLPNLHSDTSSAMNDVANRLCDFYDSFSATSDTLKQALSDLNNVFTVNNDKLKETFDSIGQTFETIKNTDFRGITEANIKVYQALDTNQHRIQTFNKYLMKVEDFIGQLNSFISKYEEKEEQLDVLKEIRDCFRADREALEERKKLITEKVGEVDQRIIDTFNQLKENSEGTVIEYVKSLDKVKDSHDKHITELFEVLNAGLRNLNNQYTKSFEEVAKLQEEQLKAMPELSKQLAELSKVPTKIDEAMGNMNNYLETTMREIAKAIVDRPIVNNNDKSITERRVFMIAAFVVSITVFAAAVVSILKDCQVF